MLEIGGRRGYVQGMEKVSVALAGNTEHHSTEARGRGAVRIRSTLAGTTHKVRFGDVVVTAPKPSKEAIRRNVDLSTEALKRALVKLIRPGIRLRAQKDVPLYSVDPENAALFIRKLNGKFDRGVLEDGQFKVVD